ncbi:hypothetical protein PN836_012195 [Ningiella sp. W23]|uniref:hypothetical protein n=1 Tax=Ningiella sp. W23 TaxID=3023715 RepID=UPI003757307A
MKASKSWMISLSAHGRVHSGFQIEYPLHPPSKSVLAPSDAFGRVKVLLNKESEHARD